VVFFIQIALMTLAFSLILNCTSISISLIYFVVLWSLLDLIQTITFSFSSWDSFLLLCEYISLVRKKTEYASVDRNFLTNKGFNKL
jgi:hypothetical protein